MALTEEEKDRSFKEITTAQRAKAIVEDPLFMDATEKIKQQVWEDFARTPINDDHGRLVARIKLELLQDFLKSLKSHMGTGKLAQETLKGMNGAT